MTENNKNMYTVKQREFHLFNKNKAIYRCDSSN